MSKGLSLCDIEAAPKPVPEGVPFCLSASFDRTNLADGNTGCRDSRSKWNLPPSRKEATLELLELANPKKEGGWGEPLLPHETVQAGGSRVESCSQCLTTGTEIPPGGVE